MPLKAVLLDFNGVILDDEAIHAALIDEILLQENLRPQRGEYDLFCLGRSDRACLDNLLSRRGRVVTPAYLDKLVAQKAAAYRARLANMEPFPFFAGAIALLAKLHAAQLKIAIVTGALRSDVDLALERGNLTGIVDCIISAESVERGKPYPDPYLRAIAALQALGGDLTAADCLAIEDTLVGVQSAREAGVKVLGVAHTYPFHMLQRRCHWVLDRLDQFDLAEIAPVFDRRVAKATA
ncbi:HAD family phosphatase [Thermosynechococcus sp. JY1334]|uniref:HAD family hydrolase n=1 Tax=unclassified Thermosynechococcus TaxID=2622553 RepID=UPI002671A66C|nr:MULTISPECIES: HAD family phosphatase [unclassified Thermosynechococcus]MDR7896981.1 HAD family phosphatase [Thermosynechococcus sp. JY1332]MDR7904378.1 HAD family phosphatase [Thermosynechococcus sp. JY1334]MDR7992215.1 HAD family phosphatase [Thermosynechococcus sp. TG252]WKT86624.1 HAD family phosphatase [Thermosynechococcus sp. JY1339]WNC55568.1 HAD family phosphatase [Thermosynechococcus sp. JY1331]